MIDHRMSVANQKAGKRPDNFLWHTWECLDDGSVMMTGCTSSGPVTKGKRKGKPKYDGDDVRVVVTPQEELAEERRFAAETGLCGECGGDGKVVQGWNHITGMEYRECPSCKGVKPTQAVDAVPEST